MNESQILVRIDEQIMLCDIWHYLGAGNYGVTIHKDYYCATSSKFVSYQVIDAETLAEISLDIDEVSQVFGVEL